MVLVQSLNKAECWNWIELSWITPCCCTREEALVHGPLNIPPNKHASNSMATLMWMLRRAGMGSVDVLASAPNSFPVSFAWTKFIYHICSQTPQNYPALLTSSDLYEPQTVSHESGDSASATLMDVKWSRLWKMTRLLMVSVSTGFLSLTMQGCGHQNVLVLEEVVEPCFKMGAVPDNIQKSINEVVGLNNSYHVKFL